MALVTSKEMFRKAYDGGYAIGAFNVNNMEIVQGITEAARDLEAPLILQVSKGARAYANHTYLVKLVEAAVAECPNIPIVLHLDHGPDFETCKSCIDGGFTSVMIDGSHLPFEENIELTREVVKYAHERGVSVEAELGVLAGVEDHVFSATSTYTNPMQAVDFFKKTGCDALAISYGTCHGANKGKDTKIRREIAIATKECMLHEGIDGYLVSHGSSTVPQEYVQGINALGGQLENAFGIDVAQLVDVARCGINKINVDTDIRLACTRNLLELFEKEPELRESASIGQLYKDLKKNPKNFDPRNYVASIMDTITLGVVPDAHVQKVVDCMKDGVTESIAPLLVQFGSYRKSHLIEVVTCEQMAERYKKAGI